MKKKTIKKLLISFFLICVLIFISIFLFGYYIINNYKPLLAKAGIFVEDNCNISKSKIVCGYININTKNFEAKIKDVYISFFIKNAFNDNKLISLKAKDINLKIKEAKKREKKQYEIPKDMKKVLTYTYLFLKKSEVIIDNINIEKENIRIKNASFKNFKNNFATLKPFYIIYNKKNKVYVSSIQGYIDKNTKRIVISEIKGNAFQANFALNGYYSYPIGGRFQGHVKGKYISLEDINIKNLNASVNLKLIDSKSIYKITGEIENFEKKNIGNFDNVLINIEGIVNENLTTNIEFKFYTAYILEDLFLKNFHLKGKVRFNTRLDNIYGNFNLGLSKIEDSNISIKNISSKFTIKKRKTLKIAGKLNLNSKLTGNFLIRNEKNNFVLNINDINGNIEDIIQFSKVRADWLVNLKGKFTGNLSYKIGEAINTNFNIKNLLLFGINFAKSDLNIKLYPKNTNFFIDGKFIQDNAFLNIKISNIDKQLSGKASYSNVDISNLYWIKNIDIKTVVSGKGKISGSINSPKIFLSGEGKFFQYKKLYIPNIKYEFSYENFKISIKANHKNNLESLVKIDLSPLNVNIDILSRNFKGKHIQDFLEDLSPETFSYLKPKELTGNLRINILKDKFSATLNFNKSKILITPVNNVFTASFKGTVTNNSINFKGNFGKTDFIFKDFHIKDLQGNFELKNRKFRLSAFARNSKNIKRFFANVYIDTDIANKILNANFSMSGEKLNYQFALSGNIYGDISNLKGSLNYGILKNNGFLVSKNKIYIKANISEKKYVKIYTKKIKISLEPKLNFIFINPQIELFSQKDNNEIYIFSPKIEIYRSKVKILNFIGFLAKADNEKIIAYPFFHSGIFEGQINYLKFWFSNKKLALKAKGRLNKEIISELVQFVSVAGDANYSLNYKGKVNEFVSKANLKIFSNNLKIKSSYIIGILEIKNLIAFLENGTLNIKLSAEDNLALLSKGNLAMYATSYLKQKNNYAYIEASNLPIKYENLFKGNINSNLNLELKKGKGKIYGHISITGNISLILDKLRKSSNNGKNSNLENIKLDIKVSSYLPIYIYGDWGEAYAEIKGHLTGTLASPIFNGEITIIYGKISYMKNNFNIDFANIKISNNIPFVTARLSTVVANTHIFINISGSPPDDLTFNFSSTPPRSREEIMAILLLRNTPNALENIPVFTAFGKLVRRILPLDKFLFSGDSSNTFLNTGFEISVAPRYSPTEGIVATIYAKRDITRRLFVALSKPISQTTSQTLVGWYEGGIRLTETTSLFTRFYEDGRNEVGIIFNLPFDF